MRKFAWMIISFALVVSLTVGCGGGDKDKDKDKDKKTEKTATEKDKDKIQGIWIVESLEVPGKKFEGDDLKPMKMDKKMVFSGDKTYPKGEEEKDESTFVLDASKSPKHLDMTSTKGDKKGKKVKAIYAFDGDDTLKVAFTTDKKEDAERPTEIAVKEKSQIAVMILKREKK